MNNASLTHIIYALLGGIIPSLIWVYFWNKEKEKSEPKRAILLAFIAGIIAVFVSLYLERLAYGKLFFIQNFELLNIWLRNFASLHNIEFNRVVLVAVFAPFIEEISKFLLAYVLVLRSKYDDEPIDPIIYMISVALGFAAIENALFLIDPIARNNILTSIVTGNMRFIGATLLHTVSSATIGFFMGFTFFDKKFEEVSWTIVGLFAAIIVHSGFNLFMIGSTQGSMYALELIWVAVAAVLLVFEKIKKIRLEKI